MYGLIFGSSVALTLVAALLYKYYVQQRESQAAVCQGTSRAVASETIVRSSVDTHNLRKRYLNSTVNQGTGIHIITNQGTGVHYRNQEVDRKVISGRSHNYERVASSDLHQVRNAQSCSTHDDMVLIDNLRISNSSSKLFDKDVFNKIKNDVGNLNQNFEEKSFKKDINNSSHENDPCFEAKILNSDIYEHNILAAAKMKKELKVNCSHQILNNSFDDQNDTIGLSDLNKKYDHCRKQLKKSNCEESATYFNISVSSDNDSSSRTAQIINNRPNHNFHPKSKTCSNQTINNIKYVDHKSSLFEHEKSSAVGNSIDIKSSIPFDALNVYVLTDQSKKQQINPSSYSKHDIGQVSTSRGDEFGRQVDLNFKKSTKVYSISNQQHSSTIDTANNHIYQTASQKISNVADCDKYNLKTDGRHSLKQPVTSNQKGTLNQQGTSNKSSASNHYITSKQASTSNQTSVSSQSDILNQYGTLNQHCAASQPGTSKQQGTLNYIAHSENNNYDLEQRLLNLEHRVLRVCEEETEKELPKHPIEGDEMKEPLVDNRNSYSRAKFLLSKIQNGFRFVKNKITDKLTHADYINNVSIETSDDVVETETFSASVQNEIEMVNTEIEEVESVAEHALCKGCMEEVADAAYVPCGHCYLCLQCAKTVFKIFKKCCICHKTVTSIEHISS